ncbi:MAG: hypothetical protein JWP91_2866 [Fibrobacteres bacterium]|nr:hypothetical protein [Fibrobacterota bacterium]
MKIKNGLIGFSLVLGLFLAACDSGDSTAPVGSGDLVGKWFYRKGVTQGTIHATGTFAGVKYDSTTVIDTTETWTDNTYFIEFKSDNSYTANSPEDIGGGSPKISSVAGMETGTWSVSGSTLTTISSEKDTTKLNVAVSGNNLTGSIVFDSTQTENGFTITSHVTATLTLSK